MPIEPSQQFLAYIHERHRQLRGGDALPESLDAWNAHKQKLRQNLLNSWGGFPNDPCDLAPQKLGELKRDGYRVEKIVFQTRPGVLMTANAYVPDGDGKRPAVLCVHGHWKGAKQDPVPQARCIGLAKLGFFVLAVDAYGAGERAIGKALGEYHGEMTATTLWPIGLPLSGLQVYENMRAADYLQSRPEVDGTKLGITGASGGGNQTMYAGGFDERFGCVVPVCSVGTYRSYLGAAACVCEIVPDVITYTEEWAVLAMVAPRALMVINATRDAFQFSVGEAQKSISQAQHVFRLHGKAGNVSHTIFESGHDYGKAMREAMYGWMTLHLKGEGQGNPIPEPPLTVEDPETLRCFPGESRPDDFLTLPKFAAREADRIIAEHDRERPQHLDQWNNTAMRMKHALANHVLGGFPQGGAVRVIADNSFFSGFLQIRDVLLEPEPGIEIRSALFAAEMTPNRIGVFLSLDGVEPAIPADELQRQIETLPPKQLPGGLPAIRSEVVKALRDAKWTVLLSELRGTGRYTVKNNRIGRAPDHNSAEWATLTGRPLLGQWIWDARRVLDDLHASRKIEDVTLIGVGPAALVALGAAIYDPRVTRIVLVNPLISFRSDVPYVGQCMGVFPPRILRDTGDIPHLASLLAPRRLLISGGVTGGGETLDAAALSERFRFTRDVYRLLGVDGHFNVAAAEKAEEMVKRIG